MSIANHRKEGFILIIAIDGPARIKYLVTTMLTICLRKHNELNVTRITLQANKVLNQIKYLIL